MGDIVELVILGGGPAGTAASVYAARKQLKTILITDTFGGQSVVSPDIQNWIGFPSISGNDLAESFKKHVQEYEGEFFSTKQTRAIGIEEKGDIFLITCENGDVIKTKSLLIGTGADRRKLTVSGADEFEHKGVTYCASCDGPLFSGKDTVVIGGGNAGFETAAQLLAYVKSVTLLHRNEMYKADALTVKKVLSHPNMTGITNASIASIEGDTFVESITYLKDGVEQKLNVEGVFIEIGLIPTTGFMKKLVDLDSVGRIITNPKTQQTSNKKIWAAGDCSDGIFHQNNIAAGDAVKALEHIYLTLRAQ